MVGGTTSGNKIDHPDLDECQGCPSCREMLYWGWRLDADPESDEWVKADEAWVCKACAAKHNGIDAEGSDNSSA